jgi:hypothetical protein
VIANCAEKLLARQLASTAPDGLVDTGRHPLPVFTKFS